MPDGHLNQAIRQVEEVIGQFKNCKKLSAEELSIYNMQFVCGWEIPRLCRDPSHGLRILLTKNFPFHPPRIAISPAPPVLTWPNLEEYGLLCLIPDSSGVSIRRPGEVVLSLLCDAQELVNTNLDGMNSDRFEDEFQSYWIRWNNCKDAMYLICCPKGPSRLVSAWHGKQYTLVADKEDTLQRWLRNQNIQVVSKPSVIQSVPLVWLPRPPHPSEYPADVSSLMSLLEKTSVEKQLVEQLLLNGQANFKTVVLGFKVRHGVGFAGLQIQKPPERKSSGSTLTKGFRGQPPDRVVLTRFGGCRVFGAKVTRFDASWIHGRDQNRDTDVLSTKSVIVIGCGALGSNVAELILKAGIGNITLIDSEIMESENVCRHVLGVDSVGGSKAKALARALSLRFPHINIAAYHGFIESFMDNNKDQLCSADLVISTTGNWRAESIVNKVFCESELFPPLLTSWLEPYAAAGHAIAFFQSKGCLCCILDELGNMRLPAAIWENKETLVPIAACGGLFQPYGASELNYTHSVIVDLAIDILLEHISDSTYKVWLAPKKLITRTGGNWNPAWINHHGDPGSGGVLLELDIEKDPRCPECGGTK